jgi:hypothetical protein
MLLSVVPPFTYLNALAAVAIALIYITLFSLVKEPNRQQFNALIIAGAGAVYWSGGLGIWEFPFGVIMVFVAFKGLTHYKYIAIGWLLHTIWDLVHHWYANPIVAWSPASSAGCAVCDTILACWFFQNAPSIFNYFPLKSSK